MNFSINEYLTNTNTDITRKGGVLKKRRKIQAMSTTNCKIFIKSNRSPEEAKVVVIRDTKELDKFPSVDRS